MSITSLIEDRRFANALHYEGRFDVPALDPEPNTRKIIHLGGSSLHDVFGPLMKSNKALLCKKLLAPPAPKLCTMEQGKRLEEVFLELLFPAFKSESLLVDEYIPLPYVGLGRCTIRLVATPDLLYQHAPGEYTLVEIKSKVADFSGVFMGVRYPQPSHKTQVLFYASVLKKIGINVTKVIVQYIAYDSSKEAIKNVGTFELLEYDVVRPFDLHKFIHLTLIHGLEQDSDEVPKEKEPTLYQVIGQHYGTRQLVYGLPGIANVFKTGDFIYPSKERSNYLGELLSDLKRPYLPRQRSTVLDSEEQS